MSHPSDEMFGPTTPPTVLVTDGPREPVWDPTMGIPVDVAAGDHPRHRLVTIGDSLTQGFQSGAVHDTDLSYPAIIAHEMGWYDRFRTPSYLGFGGLPLNIEFLMRELEAEFGHETDWRDSSLALFRVRHFLALVENWWERGPGTAVPRVRAINHNLAVYGWDLRDTLAHTAETLEEKMLLPTDPFFKQIVQNASERAALGVLKSARDEDGRSLSPFGAAARLGAEGTQEDPGQGDGIETLIVWLGTSNALPSILRLEVVWSEEGYDDLERKDQFTVWNPVHFQAELDLVVEEIKKIRARHVILGTVPHVTIAPIVRGVGPKVRDGSRYYRFYTRPWIRDEDFNAENDPHLTEQEARAIDSAIDQYNDAITQAVKDARNDGFDWYLFDVAGILDCLAFRRYIDDISARPVWWEKFELPSELAALGPELDTLFFASGPEGRTSGGLFSLDGIHLTTVGNGILAQELINVMQQHAGVKFYRRGGHRERRGPVKVDFRRLIQLDTLISDPPRSLISNVEVIAWLDEKLNGMIHRILY